MKAGVHRPGPQPSPLNGYRPGRMVAEPRHTQPYRRPVTLKLIVALVMVVSAATAGPTWVGCLIPVPYHCDPRPR